MRQLSKNFWRHEMACKCGCGFDSIDIATLQVLQECCDHFAEDLDLPKVTCVVNSAARCEDHNKAIGGSTNSQHLRARAIDFKILGVPPKEVCSHLVGKYPKQYGIGRYDTFTHLDTRTNGPARW